MVLCEPTHPSFLEPRTRRQLIIGWKPWSKNSLLSSVMIMRRSTLPCTSFRRPLAIGGMTTELVCS
jgi:hypothetical protein